MAYSEPNYQEIRAKIAHCIQELPALPVVVAKVLEETQKENVTATSLERLIGSDQALAAKTLRVVNSAYYGMSKKIDSLSQAVVILGIQQIRNLVLSISAMSVFRARTPVQKEAHRQFWLHSIASASGALTMARKMRASSHDQEVAFVAGLMHEVGRLFLFTNFTDIYIEIDKLYRSGEDLHELEKKQFGLTHAQVGQVLAHVWKFPPRIGALMSTHDGPFDESSDALALAIHVAHNLSDQLLISPNAIERLDPFAVKWLQTFEDEMFQIKNEVEAKVYAYEMLYGMLAA